MKNCDSCKHLKETEAEWGETYININRMMESVKMYCSIEPCKYEPIDEEVGELK